LGDVNLLGLIDSIVDTFNYKIWHGS